MKTVTVQQLKNVAKILIDDGTNTEYVRGICELIADVDGISEMDHAERAIEIAEEIGMSKHASAKMYDQTIPEMRGELITVAERLARLLQEVELPEDAVGVIIAQIDGINNITK